MSKKVLFLVNSGTISSNVNGGASVYFSHLELLHTCNFKVELLVILWNENDVFKEEDYKEVKQFVTSISSCKLSQQKYSKPKRFFYALTNPTKFEYNFVNAKNADFLKKTIQQKKIGIVWCEWRWTAILATNSSLKVPVVYSHHDWEYKLAPLRKKQNLKAKFHNYQKKRVEFSVVRKAAACISGSFFEAQEIERISEKKALYLPTTYTPVSIKLVPNKTPNIVHLGGMNTTANRKGLERFLDVCWQQIKQQNPLLKLKVIGSLKNANATLQTKLKDNQIECLGFVQNLEEVLCPEDIHIIPWEYNTGTRTRVPVVFNYEQTLVAINDAVKAFPEVTSNNTILCNSLEEMTAEIIKIVDNPVERKKLSKNGKQTFLNTFTKQSQVEKLSFLNNLSNETA